MHGQAFLIQMVHCLWYRSVRFTWVCHTRSVRSAYFLCVRLIPVAGDCSVINLMQTHQVSYLFPILKGMNTISRRLTIAKALMARADNRDDQNGGDNVEEQTIIEKAVSRVIHCCNRSFCSATRRWTESVAEQKKMHNVSDFFDSKK